MNANLLRIALLVATFAIITGSSQGANAQVSTTAYVNNYILNRPTVSPYLNLVRRDGFGGVTNYQTLVRPQLEQREFARQQQAQILRVEQQVAAQRQRSFAPVPTQRAARTFSTGHPTQFQNTGNYYPGLNLVRQR